MSKRNRRIVVEVQSSSTRRPVNNLVPSIPDDWDAIKEMDAQALREMGCRAFDEPEMGTVVMLLPGEWHAHLPKGLELESVSGRKVMVGRDYIDDDIRFGLLPYGIRARVGGKR